MNKEKMSEAINEILGLKDDSKIDWTRLKSDDLMAWYLLINSPKELAEIVKNMALGGGPGGGLFNLEGMDLEKLKAKRPLLFKALDTLLEMKK